MYVSLETRDKHRQTALCFALSGGHNAVVVKLLQMRADPHVLGNKIITVTRITVLQGDNEVVRRPVGPRALNYEAD